MRLISKETVLNGLIDWQFTSDDDKEYATIEQMIKSIEETPTVEAIPVKWIRDESRKAMEPNSYRDYDLIYASCMLQLLEHWEKENGQNN